MQQVCLKVSCSQMKENFALFWSHDQSLITNNRFLKTKCLLRVQPNIYFTKSSLFLDKDKSKAGFSCKDNSLKPLRFSLARERDTIKLSNFSKLWFLNVKNHFALGKAGKVQRADLMCDVIRKVAPFVLSKLEYSSLIGQCAGHVTRFL